LALRRAIVDLEAWLRGLGLEQYARAFADNDIDAQTLRDLNGDDLKDIGVASVGHRKRLLAAIAGLSEENPERAPATESATASGERRQVTILFADLAGFTELSSALDAEELHGLVSRFFAAVDRVVAHYGGAVDKHMGDAVMALFGAPVAHGDDPLRAVRAAFDIHAAMADLSAELGRKLSVHVGIASGEVVAGSLGSEQRREYTVLGDSVNLAARLDDLAEPGQTLIADAVYRAVSAAVDCAALGEVPVKGLERPVRVWRARGLAAEAGSARRGPLVGRKSELRQFAGVLEACRETGTGQAILLRGEAGIGKTRLVEEFAALARAQGFSDHKGLVLDFGVGKGQDAIRALVRSLLGLGAGADDAKRAAAAAAAVAAGWFEADRRVFLNDLLDLAQPTALRSLYDAMDNAARNTGKQEVVAGLAQGASGRGPVIVTVEDVHWAAPLTLAHLARMTAAVRDCPAVLVMTTRIEGDPLDGAWRSTTGGSPLLTIDLGPLREAEALELTSGLIEVSDRVARDCIARAEGNPLFLEQLLHNAEEGADEAVPASIQSLILARMDRLAGVDKAALQAASAIGQRFDIELLKHLIEDPGYDCTGLIEHNLVRSEGAGYLFAHALICEGAYSSLLKAKRRKLHARAAQWFAEEDPVLHAEHLDHAEDPGAPRAYLDAAQAQSKSYRYERALSLLGRGLELARSTEDKFALTCMKGNILHDLGSIPEGIEVCKDALELATDDTEQCRAWISLAAGMRVIDQFDEAFDALDKAEGLAQRHGLTHELAQIHYIRGNLYFPLGKIDECREEHQLALKYAREANSPEAEARALSGVADAEYARGRMITAYNHFQRCVELCREHGFGRIEVANLSMLGFSRYFHSTMELVVEDCTVAIEAAAKVGHHRAELLAQSLGFLTFFELGELDRTKDHIEKAQALVRRLGARRFDTQNLVWKARVMDAEGRRSEALELLEQALEISRETGMGFNGPRVLSRIAFVTEDPERRRSVLEEGESILRSGAVSHSYFWFYRDAIEVSLRIGDWGEVERYAKALEDYTRPEPLPWCDFFIARGRALAAFGHGERNPEILAELQRLRDEANRVGLKTALAAVDEALGQR
jgi:class 3 adenylate cyclase/tetratricopeptide (TPR) repeat protein